jgi:hypothetical protein
MNEPGSGPAATLLDELLPTFEVVERHATELPVPPAAAWRLVRETDFGRSAVIRVLFRLRGLTPRFRPAGRGGRARIRLDDFVRAGFLDLGQRGGRELVVGTVVGPAADGGRLGPAAFAALRSPGHIKIAMSFLVAPAGTGALVSTETRVHTTDRASRRRFAAYWLLVGPFSALIRRRMLALLRAGAR